MNATLLEMGLVGIEEEIKVISAQIPTFKKPSKQALPLLTWIPTET